MADIRNEILSELMLEYKRTLSEESFRKILKRTDLLTFRTIRKLQRYKTYLAGVDLQELYHTAIIGICNAALSLKETENNDMIAARIIAYIEASLWKTFYKLDREMTVVDIERYADEEYYDSHELFDFHIYIAHRCEQLMLANIIDEQDLVLLKERMIHGNQFHLIAKNVGLPVHVVRRRIIKIIDAIVRKPCG